MGFVQIIELSTDRFAEVEAAMGEWLAATSGRRTATRSVLGRDLERPERFVQVVEFPSREEAMANSALPETAALADKLAELCTSPPTYRDLDLVRADEL